jgi:hypothetical protein
MATKKQINLIKKAKRKLKERSQGNSMIFLKPDETIRVRVLPVPDDEEFYLEAIQFYLGQEIKGVLSPASFGEPCAIMETHEELSHSSDKDEKKFASKFPPRTKYLIPVIKYQDKKGKKVDTKLGVRLVLCPITVAQQLMDFFLDDELGDFTDSKTGYDIKITRTGSGQMDTEYSTVPCRPTKLNPKFNKEVDLEEMVRKEIPSYERTQELISQYLGLDDDDNETDKKKKKGKNNKSLKKGKKGKENKGKRKGIKKKR